MTTRCTRGLQPGRPELATASYDNRLDCGMSQTGKELQRLEHDDSVNAVAFSPDGQKLATASDDNTARLWDVETRQRAAEAGA